LYFYNFTLSLFIIIYLSLFFNIFLLFLFSPLYLYLEKILITIFYTLNIYHFTLYLFISSFFLFLSLFFCNLFFNFFFFTIVFLKKYYTKTKKIVFHFNNYNIVLFFCYIKNYLEILHIFINVYDLHYILLYPSINFLIHGYIFYSISKKYLTRSETS
jgi:hypothetical protein